MNIQNHVLAWSVKRLFVICCGACVLSATMISASAWAQDADDGEKAAKMAEAAVRAQEDAIKRMAVQLEAHQKALIEQQKMMEAQVEAQQKAIREQQKQFEARQQDFQRARAAAAMADGQKAQAPSAPNDFANDASRMYQSQAVQAAMAQLQAMNQKARATPLSENAQTRVFALKYGKPGEISRVLADIVGERGMRTGIDERSNSLIVSADEKTMSIVDALVQRLDSPGGGPPSSDFADTLQVRVVWLLDEIGDGDANEGIVSPQVLQALKQLGFKTPGVVSQQVATLTLDDKSRGRFNFLVPVLVNGQHWQLAGNGLVTQNDRDRFALQFELEVEQTNNPNRCRIGGSIFTPLGHYTVMGTSTFVGESDGKSWQHPSAFVVYLDRAPEFPADKPAEADEKSATRP